MARKQSLANKRRSQKRSNKKRARTNRSMRQVNRKGKGLFENLGKLGSLRSLGRLGRSDKFPLLSREFLLDPDEKEPVLEEPRMVSRVHYVPPKEIGVQPEEEEKPYEKNTLYDNLKFLLLLHVIIHYPVLVSDNKIFDRIHEFIFNPNNEHLVLDPFIQHINNLLTKNSSTIKNIFQTDTRKTEFINSIDSDIFKLKKNVSVNVDYLNLCSVILEQLIVYFNSTFNESINMETAKTIASLTFLDIFKDRMVNFELAGVIQESKFLKQHVDDIKEYYSVTAGGSKGKMRRPKSRTRKL